MSHLRLRRISERASVSQVPTGAFTGDIQSGYQLALVSEVSTLPFHPFPMPVIQDIGISSEFIAPLATDSLHSGFGIRNHQIVRKCNHEQGDLSACVRVKSRVFSD